jgi:D-alanine-D-alanine ligase-like ATP-grasp enzyme
MNSRIVAILFGVLDEFDTKLTVLDAEKQADELISSFKEIDILAIKVYIPDLDFLTDQAHAIKEIYRYRDIIFYNAILGSHGYTGEVVKQLEFNNLSYFGCSSTTQMIASQKQLAKQILGSYELEVLPDCILQEGTRVIKNKKVIRKPLFGSGSSNIQVFKPDSNGKVSVNTGSSLEDCIVEEFCEGIDITVLHSDKGPKHLAAHIITENNMHDAAAKFEGKSQFVKYELTEEQRNIIDTVWSALKCKDVIRVDARVLDDGTIYVVDVNTQLRLTQGGAPMRLFNMYNESLPDSELLKSLFT